MAQSKFDGMSASDAKRLKALETENSRLKRLLAKTMLETETIKDGFKKKVVSAPARRELVHGMVARGINERCALRMARMSASAYRCNPAAEQNCELRSKIIALAQRHRRYGVGMIYLKLRQAGGIATHNS